MAGEVVVFRLCLTKFLFYADLAVFFLLTQHKLSIPFRFPLITEHPLDLFAFFAVMIFRCSDSTPIFVKQTQFLTGYCQFLDTNPTFLQNRKINNS